MAFEEHAAPGKRLEELFALPEPRTEDFSEMLHIVERLPVESDADVGRCFARIEGLALRAGNGTAVCASRMKLAQLLHQRGDFDASLAAAERVLEAARASREKRYEGSYHFLVGRIHESTGRYDEARDCYQRCHDIYCDVGQTEGQRKALNQLGNIHLLRGDAEAALKCYRRCLELDDSTLNDHERATYFDNVGHAQQSLGRWEDALESYYRALATSERLESDTDRVSGSCYRLNSIGELYVRRAMLDKAIDAFSKVVSASERSSAIRTGLLADVRAHLGQAHERSGNFASAEKNYQLGLELAESLGDRRAESVLNVRTAELALKQGQLGRGHALAAQAHFLAQEMGLKTELCEACRIQALLYADEGKEAEARVAFERSLASASALPDSYELALTRLQYGRFLLRAGESEAAEEHLRQAARVFRQLSVVAEAEETNRLLLSRELAADRGVALLHAVSELTAMRLDPGRFLEQCLKLLCDALGYEAGVVVSDSTAVSAHGAADLEAAARLVSAGRSVSGPSGACWPAGNAPAFICLQRPTAPGTEHSPLMLEAVGNLMSGAVRQVLRTVARPRPADELKYKGVVGTNPRMADLLATAARVAGTNVTVLIRGESGTGKELVARALHDSGPRARGPFCAMNCAAVPETLLEAELFGVEKGAATGVSARKGKLEHADGGTVFLDEIGDMSASLQAKLLRVLQERVVERVGGRQEIPVDVRVVAATNRSIQELIDEGRFRSDLYFRINTVELVLPALRERREDIPALLRHFIALCNRDFRRSVAGIKPEVLSLLMKYDWPGNIRELQHVVERAVIVSGSGQIDVADLPAALVEAAQAVPKQDLRVQRDEAARTAGAAVERETLLSCLEKCGGNVTEAARAAGYSRAQFYRLLRKHGISSKDRPGKAGA